MILLPAIDPVSYTHLQQGQLPGGHGGAPVVVGVDGDNDVLPAVEMLAHVLNLLGIDVGHGHLHGGGEVDDDLPFRPGLPDVDDRVADPQGKLHLLSLIHI